MAGSHFTLPFVCDQSWEWVVWQRDFEDKIAPPQVCRTHIYLYWAIEIKLAYIYKEMIDLPYRGFFMSLKFMEYEFH